MSKNIVTVVIAATLFAGCAVAPEPVTDGLKPSTAWVAYSDEWRLEAEAVYSEATDFIVEAAQTRDANTWAVVLDIDETVLNNVDYQIARDLAGLTFDAQSWFEWTQAEAATLVPGAKAFINAVTEAGGLVALVTNRKNAEQLATENNLAALNIRRQHDFRVLLTRSPSAPGEKSERFALVPEALRVQGFPGVDIIAYLGDGNGDKPADLAGSRFFCIDQGAMYGDPCAAVPGPGK